MRNETDFRAYQPPAIDFMLENERCALWAGCGLGKTVTVLTVLQYLRTLGDERPALVLGPKKVAESVWSDEVGRWSHLQNLRVETVIGNAARRSVALGTPANVYTTNYENIPWLIETLGGAWPFGTIIADEATKLKSHRASLQTHPKTGKRYIRAAGGKRAAALAKVAHAHRGRFIELSGTPAPNGLVDLWGQIWFLDFGQRLGRTFEAFENRWFRSERNGFGLEPLDHAEGEIHEALSDICLSIDPKDWFDLKEPVHIPVYVDLPGDARRAYYEMEKHMFTEILANPIEALNGGSKSMKCRQLANGAAYVNESNVEWVETHDAKLEALARIEAEAGGMPLIVAYTFRSDLARIKKAFPHAQELSPRVKDDFIRGKVPMLLLHPESAGHGVDGLQYGTNSVVFFGHDWALDTRQQLIERVGPVRQAQAGFDRAVMIYDIIARDTVDEAILERHTSKRSAQDCLLNYMKRRT